MFIFCGSHFSAEFVLLDEKNGLLTYKLLYDGTGIGYMIYDGDAELSIDVTLSGIMMFSRLTQPANAQ